VEAAREIPKSGFLRRAPRTELRLLVAEIE
jgi:hypothetical protein